MHTVATETSGAGLRIAVVVSRFNEDIGERLLQGALDTAAANGVPEWGITVIMVPGAFELPMVANELDYSGRYDAIVCAGCVIRGETSHFDYVSAETTRGIAEVAREHRVPVTLGVITADNREQAEARSGGKKTNMGSDAMLAAINMANIFRELHSGLSGRSFQV